MLRFFLLLVLIPTLNVVVFPQKENDLDKWGVKKKVRQINDYNSYDLPASGPQNPPARSLSYITVFNRNGNLSRQFEFFNSGAECFYRKTVFSYDRKKRKKETARYESEKDAAFCVAAPPLLKKTETEPFERKSSLIEKTRYAYDPDGRLIRETIFDRNQNVVQENSYEYNRRGENTRYTINQQVNRISGASGTPVKTIDFRMSYDDVEKTQRTDRYEDGRLIYKIFYYKDKKGRPVKEEQYRIETDAENNIIRETLSSLSKSVYDGSKEIFDWSIYDNSGKLSQQLYLLSEDDNELMRLEYSPRAAVTVPSAGGSERSTHYLFDSADDPEINRRLRYLVKFDRTLEDPNWMPSDFEAKFYKFDARGNIIQTSTLRRERTAPENSRITVSQRDFIYYR
jgi:hypothetical protein